MSDERDETRSFSPFDDDTWADDDPSLARRRPSPRREGPGRDAAGEPARREAQPESSDAPTVMNPAAGPADETEVDPATRSPGATAANEGGRPPDATVVSPSARPSDATVVDSSARPPDATVVDSSARPPDATAVMPPAAGGAAWSGRAEVRPPQPTRTEYQQVTDWPTGPGPQRNDRWWMPIVVGIVALVLLAALGWGIYLIVQNAGKNNAPAGTTSASPAPTTVATTTETTQPTTAPTTTEPSTTASTTEPTNKAVAIPALRGLSVADAKAALKDVGITSTRVIYRPSDGEPDTVIDSDPEEGQEVPPDTRVTLVVSAPSTATTATTTAGTGAGD